MKHCNKCDSEKDNSAFDKQSAAKDGLCSVCKECRKIDKRNHHQKNKEKHNAKSKQYHLENRESALEYRRSYYQSNKERMLAWSKEWNTKNKHRAAENGKRWRERNACKILASNRNRKAAIKNAYGSHTPKEVDAIFSLQLGLCANCLCKLFKSGKKKFHVDHIMPLARGGSNDRLNLQCLCPGCNTGKKDKDPIFWAQQNGRLL